jgi:predicted nucleotide-binding protein
MAIDFGALIIDLETLAGSSNEDFDNEFWNSYEKYMTEYNRLLGDVQSLGFYKNLKPVEPVPFSDQSFNSGFSDIEKAKLREVANASSALLKKVRLLLSPPSATKLSNNVRSNQIFVVYGKEDEISSDVIQTLQKLELEPIIINEESASKKCIIEKIADYPHVSFAVVILSPEYLAYHKEDTDENMRYMASQDVILELGYFLGKLGNQNVVTIYNEEEDFEVPRGFSGVIWIEHKTGWYFQLIRELKECNFDVDANKLGWL